MSNSLVRLKKVFVCLKEVVLEIVLPIWINLFKMYVLFSCWEKNNTDVSFLKGIRCVANEDKIVYLQNSMCQLMDKIDEMAGVMQKAIEVRFGQKINGLWLKFPVKFISQVNADYILKDGCSGCLLPSVTQSGGTSLLAVCSKRTIMSSVSP